MASYTHICAECGAKMRVHERYHGRRLRCTACRTEFVADPHGDRSGDVATAEIPAVSTQVCLACGLEMQISERYFGKTLRCTGCGEEFVARLPMVRAADAAESLEPAVGLEGTGRETPAHPRTPPWRRIAVVGVVIALAAVALWWLGGDREAGFGSSLFQAQRGRTDIGVLRSGDEPVVMVALDRDTAVRLARAIDDEDESARAQLAGSPNCLPIAAGSRVRVLERRKRGVEARVRILDGPQNSRIVWVPVSCIR
jgi:hypothetical protein